MKTTADILICGMYKYASTGLYEIKSYINPGRYDKPLLTKHFYSTMLFDYDKCQPALPPSLCNKLIRSDIIRNVMEDVAVNITYGEDALCSYACILDAERIHVMGQQLYYYRENPDSVSNVYNKQMFSALRTLGSEMVRLFEARNCNLQSQIYGYLARLSLEGIRNELLYHTGVTFREKKKKIKTPEKKPIIRR